jgi:hypothetical protein
MEDTSGRFWQSLFMVFNGTGFAGSHDCGNFSGSDGNIVKCEWRRSFSDVDYQFRKEEWLSNVDYIIYRRKFYQTKAAFFVTERVYRQLLKYYFSAFYLICN